MGGVVFGRGGFGPWLALVLGDGGKDAAVGQRSTALRAEPGKVEGEPARNREKRHAPNISRQLEGLSPL